MTPTSTDISRASWPANARDTKSTTASASPSATTCSNVSWGLSSPAVNPASSVQPRSTVRKRVDCCLSSAAFSCARASCTALPAL